ncbi:MAG: glycogen synthase GlgA [Heliobacteriaceae bacterium]|nr:glycogen synthase GlgA [Heliobacteriaceae bacterium]MDD4588387.1 glycogen synthase GlgA [Heliobacteriaceae bacterium]
MTKGPLKVLYAATEVTPLAKTGGLADVAGSLPRALRALGLDIRIVLPRYKNIPGTYVTDFPVRLHGRWETAIVRETRLDPAPDQGRPAVPVYLIDNYRYFHRDELYGYPDDGERWAFFSRALLALGEKIDFIPDVLHLNDWQVGPAAAILRTEYRSQPLYAQTAAVLTVHNLEYQGLFGKDILGVLGLPTELFHPDGVEFYGQVNFLKAGLVFADSINTVSPTYAEEIRTPEFGQGLDRLLVKRAADLYGIINGIDDQFFNPATDPCVPFNYSASDFGPKRRNKAALQRELGLPENDVPVFGWVSRLVDQKGFDLLGKLGEDLLNRKLQLVVLGKGDPRYEGMLRDLKKRFPTKVGLHIGFNAPLAQRIYAGSDFFLMPSRFEPCGLGQLIGLRYGTIPVVRATGGLADTVIDCDQDQRHGNGLVFSHYGAEDFRAAVLRALALYAAPARLEALVGYGMRQDFSWGQSARGYVAMYRKTTEKVEKSTAGA